jgi:hypothetical protein
MPRPALLLVLAACGNGVGPPNQTSTASDLTDTSAPTSTSTHGGGHSETGAGVTTSTTSTTGTSTPTTTTTETTATIPDDIGDIECSAFAQDCPPGTKCNWYVADGGNTWNKARCVAIMDDPDQFDEACFVVGEFTSGVDSCDIGLLCWEVDPATNRGTCVSYCVGTEEAPFCSMSKHVCLNSSEFALCYEECDPLAQDCSADEICFFHNFWFICDVDASGAEGQIHDPCMFVNVCDPGNLCVDFSIAAVECDQSTTGCCEPYCDLTLLNTCPGEGQVCRPFFEEGTTPPGLEHIGVCALP